ncbi:MAG: alpha-2-macroglobulin family protein [bacterium]
MAFFSNTREKVLGRACISIFILLIFLLLVGCGESGSVDSSKIKYSPETAQMVSHVTSGVISSSGDIRVRFVAPMVDRNLVGNPLEKRVFSFTPSIDGIARWEDEQTLSFKPNAPLPLRQRYAGRLNMASLFPQHRDKSLEPLDFQFEVAGREIASLTGDFRPLKEDDPEHIIYEGTIVFTEPADPRAVERSVTLLVDSQKLPLKWSAEEDGKEFTFTTSEIKRDNKKKNFVLKVDKSGLEISDHYQRQFSLEPLQDLKIAKILIREEGLEPSVKIEFSDELDPEQDIIGLIGVEPYIEVKLKKVGKSVYVLGDFAPGERYTVRVSPGIRSKWGTKIDEEVEEEIEFSDIKPQISFVSDGVFLPSSNQQKITFKTVNLRNVRLEIKRVFENNLGQFLQTENLNSAKDRTESFNTDYVNRVGVEIARETLPIGEERNVWLQHELDLKKIIRPGEKGLFLVSLSFEREDMIYRFDEDESRDYYGDDYYSNPNSQGYIYAHGRIYKPVVLSDIGLTYKRAHRRHLVFATNILNARPMGGVAVTLRTYQNQVIARKTTDGDGKADFEDIAEEVFYVEAEAAGQRSIIKPNEMAWNLSSFDTEGEELRPGVTRAFIYTERGVYRPGDEINLSIIVRNEDNTFPDNHPVTLKVFNPLNQLVLERTQKDGKDGFYSFKFQTKPEDPTGNWRAEVLAGSRTFQHTLKIETVAPYRLKINIEPEKAQMTSDDEILKVNISSIYLFGNPAAGLDAEVSVSLNHALKRFPQYPGYIFSNQAIDYEPLEAEIFKDKLDQDGKAFIEWTLPPLERAPSAIEATITAKVFEKGGRATRNDLSIPIDPYKYYVGLQKPEMDYGYARVGSTIGVNAILVDAKGEAAPGRQLTYRLYKNNRYWWWEYDTREQFRLSYKTDSNTELVEEGTITSRDVPVTLEFKPEDWGEYLVEVQAEAEDSMGHTAGFFFSAYHWGEVPTGAKDAGILTLKSDKKTYHPGEVAQISFPTPQEGGILVSVESATKIISARWYKPETGERETRIKIPITTEMLPTAYAAISVIQPHSQTLNDRPIRMYGIIPLNVEDASTHQKLAIQMADELEPNRPFDVEIQTADGRPTQFTIAVVDEGLLDLTRFKTPDPWREFFKKQRLGVMTYDLFPYVIGANKGDIFKTFSVGGGYYEEEEISAGQAEEREKAKRFKPVSMFKGPIATDDRGRSKVSFDMPNYIGSVRVMVISAKGNSYGSEEKTVPVKTDLVVLPTLPRVLGPEDEIVVPVTVFALKDNIGKVDVSMELEGPLISPKRDHKVIEFKRAEERDVQFRIQANPEVGPAKIIVTASSAAYTAKSETDIYIRPSSPRIYESEEKPLSPGQRVSFTVPDRGIPGTNNATISIARQPKLNLNHRLRWLIHYPYGCIEQTVSSVFPQLYLKEFTKKSPKDEKAIDENINAAIQRLRKFQISSGAFSYWPGQTEASIWGTNYAGHFLIEAKKLGYSVPDDLMNDWIRYQKSRALTTKDNLMERVYRVYLLALAGEPHLGPMNFLKENSLKDMSDVQKWMLAASYKLAGVERTARQISGGAGFNVSDYRELGGTYGSGLRDKAIILEMATLFGRWNEADNLYREISEYLSSDEWYSTQTTGYALLALGKYIGANAGAFGGERPMLSGSISLPNGDNVPFNTDQIKFSWEITEGFGKRVEVHLDERTNVKRAFAVLEWDGVPLRPDVKDESKNLTLTVEWYDQNGMSLDPTDLVQGTTFWGHFKASKAFSPRRDLEELALAQILPSGWEIENIRLSGEDLPAWMSRWRLHQEEYLDIRDDRIMWFFDMPYDVASYDFVVKLSAVTAGEFDLPPTLFEAMYDHNNYKAVKAGKKVIVRAKP